MSSSESSEFSDLEEEEENCGDSGVDETDSESESEAEEELGDSDAEVR